MARSVLRRYPVVLFLLVTDVFWCFSSGLVSHSDLDDRAIEALKEFNEEGALQVLLQFKDSDLSHVQVCMAGDGGLIALCDHVLKSNATISPSKVYRFLFNQQNKSAFLCGVMKTYRQREKQGTKVSDSSKGPDEAKIKVRF